MADLECGDLFVNFSGYSEEEVIEWYINSPTSLMICFVVLPIIVGFGIITNFSFIVTFIRTDWMKNRLYFYLLHLSLVDISILLLAYSQRLITTLPSPFNFAEDAFGEASCVVGLIIEALYYASLIIVTFISMERYFAICHPLRHMTSTTRMRVAVAFLGTWTFSLTVAGLQIPKRFDNQVFCVVYSDDDVFSEYPKTVRRCTPLLSGYEDFYSVLQLIVFYTCLLINIYCYWNIVCKMFNRSDIIERENASVQSSRVAQQSRRSTTRMIAINCGAYFLCNSPAQFFLTLELVSRLSGHELQIPGDVVDGMFRVFQVLIYVNSAINPLIYSAINTKYRSAMANSFKVSSSGNSARSVRTSSRSKRRTQRRNGEPEQV